MLFQNNFSYSLKIQFSSNTTLAAGHPTLFSTCVKNMKNYCDITQVMINDANHVFLQAFIFLPRVPMRWQIEWCGDVDAPSTLQKSNWILLRPLSWLNFAVAGNYLVNLTLTFIRLRIFVFVRVGSKVIFRFSGKRKFISLQIIILVWLLSQLPLYWYGL
jgi:hypothetical protein